MKPIILLATKEYKKEFVNRFTTVYFETTQEAKNYFNAHIKTKTLYILFLDVQAGFFAYAREYSHYANYLEDICVLPDYRRKGYAKLLLDKFIQQAKREQTKNTIALSSTHKNNTVSIHMYESYGFKKIGVLKKLHYGIDEIFYGYELL